MLPSYRHQSIDLHRKSIAGFYMRATMEVNGLKKEKNTAKTQIINAQYCNRYLKSTYLKTASLCNLKRTLTYKEYLTGKSSRDIFTLTG